MTCDQSWTQTCKESLIGDLFSIILKCGQQVYMLTSMETPIVYLNTADVCFSQMNNHRAGCHHLTVTKSELLGMQILEPLLQGHFVNKGIYQPSGFE